MKGCKMRLTDGKLHLVMTQQPDEELVALMEDERELRNLTETRKYPPDMPQEMIFRIESDGETAGEMRLKSIRWFNHKAEISIFIAEKFRGQGLGQRALRLIIDYALRQMNLHRLEAEVVSGNDPAIKLLETSGFVREGILREAKYLNGGYADIIQFGLLKNEYASVNPR